MVSAADAEVGNVNVARENPSSSNRMYFQPFLIDLPPSSANKFSHRSANNHRRHTWNPEPICPEPDGIDLATEIVFKFLIKCPGKRENERRGFLDNLCEQLLSSRVTAAHLQLRANHMQYPHLRPLKLRISPMSQNKVYLP